MASLSSCLRKLRGLGLPPESLNAVDRQVRREMRKLRDQVKRGGLSKSQAQLRAETDSVKRLQGIVKEDIKTIEAPVEDLAPQQRKVIETALEQGKSVSADAVEKLGITVPEGFKRSGGLIVAPEAPTRPVEAPRQEVAPEPRPPVERAVEAPVRPTKPIQDMSLPELRAEASRLKMISTGTRKGLINRLTGVSDLSQNISLNRKQALKIRLSSEARASKRASVSARKELIEGQKIDRDIDKTINQIVRFGKLKPQNITEEAKAHIDSILGRYKFKPTTKKQLAERKALIPMLDSFRASGEVIPFSNERIAEIEAIPREQLTLDNLREIRDTVKMVATLGRNSKRMLGLTEKKRITDVISDVEKQIFKTGGKPIPEPETVGFVPPSAISKGKIERSVEGVKSFLGAHRKVEFLDFVMDGQTFTPKAVQKNISRRIQSAGTKELLDGEKVFGKLEKLMTPLSREWSKQQTIAGLKMTTEEKIGIYLNSQNKGNLFRLTNEKGNKLTEGQVEAVVRAMTPTEKTFADGVFRIMEGLRGETFAVAKKMTGITPEAVEGRYFPIVSDPAASQRIKLAQAEADLFQNVFNRTFVQRGFVEKRTGGTDPVNLKALDVIHGHLNDVIHFNSHAIPVRDVQKVITSPRFRRAVTDVMGEANFRQYSSWLKDVANPSQMPMSFLERASGRLRRNATSAILGVKVSVAFVQPGSITQTIQQVGLAEVSKGMFQFYRNPFKMSEFIKSQSPQLKARGQTMDREIRDFISSGRNAHLWKDKPLGPNLFFAMIRTLDKAATYPTWIAGYNKGLRRTGDVNKAIDVADALVRRTQPQGSIKDLAEVSRGSEFKKVWTSFYSHFSNFHNLVVAQADYIRLPGDHPAKKTVNVAAAFMWLLVIPALYSTWARKGFKLPSAKEMAFGLASYATSGLLLIRDLAGAVKFRGGRVSGPPALRFLEEAGRGVAAAFRGDKMEVAERAIKSVATFNGVPTDQVLITIGGAYDLATGESDDLRRLIISKPALEGGKPKSRGRRGRRSR